MTPDDPEVAVKFAFDQGVLTEYDRTYVILNRWYQNLIKKKAQSPEFEFTAKILRMIMEEINEREG